VLLRVLVLMALTTLGVRAETCPVAVSKGIDYSGTDYYDAKEAACLPKEREALKNSILAIASNKPRLAWNIADALLCRKGSEPRELISPRIVNPLKEVISIVDAPDLVERHRRKASELMERGCAFSPKAERVSDSSIKVSYIPYQTGAYCGSAFVLEYRKSNWFIVERRGACD